MATTMIGSYSNSSGIGVETRCLNFNMHWDGFPLTSKFYFSISTLAATINSVISILIKLYFS